MIDTTTTDPAELIRELGRLRDRLYNIIVADGLARLNSLRTGDPPPPSRDDEIAALRERTAVLWDRLAALRALEAE